ncbi:MAG: hypothetical protein ACRERX_22505 [Pseudomonas sp.]
MMSTGLQLVMLAVGANALAGCGESRQSRAVVRDSAGVVIVENAQPDSAAVTWWQISAAPDLDIGAVEGSESETLFRVTDTKRLSDGRVVVANSGAAQVRYYDSDGKLDTIAGKSGGGPGEFQRITQLIVLPGDSVVVQDPPARRMTLLDARGRFVRNFGVDGVLATILGPAPAGGWIGTLRYRGEPSMTGGNVRQDLLYALVTSDGNAVTDTIGRFAGNERHIRITQSGGQISSINIFAPPFARSTTVRLQGDALIVGTQDAPELRVYGIDGGLRRIIRTGAGQTPITKDHIDRFIERGVAGLPEDQANSVRQNMATLPSPDFLPSYGTFLIDRSGNLWLQDYPGLQDAQRWSIFDPEGSLLARIALPDRFTPYDIGADWIAGKELDELDVEHARVYWLTRSR